MIKCWKTASEPRLTTKEMKEAMIVFTECQKITHSELIDDQKFTINKWISDVVLTINPCYSLRPDALEALTDSIFLNTYISEFVLELSFRFFSLWGDYDNSSLRLSRNIEQGLIIDGPNIKLSEIPAKVSASMVQTIFNEIKLDFINMPLMNPFVKPLKISNFLNSNKHLLTVDMLYLTNTNSTTA